MLLGAVVAANRGRAVWDSTIGAVTVVAFPTDLLVIETLFTSLLVQAVQALDQHVLTAPAGARERSRAYRRSFLVAYAARIGERLRAASEASTRDAVSHHGSGLAPVLASREVELIEALADLFPNVRKARAKVSDLAGVMAGRVAADRADLDVAGKRLRGGAALRSDPWPI
jgi:hypothetical protein